MNSTEKTASTGKPKVLVVDDEEVIGYLIQRVVTNLGYAVEWVTHCEAALARISAQKYDLILSDFKMPNMTGEEFYHRLADLDATLLEKLVFITGDTVNSKTMKFLQSRNISYLSKPFDLQELETLIQNRIHGRKQQTRS
jgi:CheY-like chemotaxis protein